MKIPDTLTYQGEFPAISMEHKRDKHFNIHIKKLVCVLVQHLPLYTMGSSVVFNVALFLFISNFGF